MRATASARLDPSAHLQRQKFEVRVNPVVESRHQPILVLELHSQDTDAEDDRVEGADEVDEAAAHDRCGRRAPAPGKDQEATREQREAFEQQPRVCGGRVEEGRLQRCRHGRHHGLVLLQRVHVCIGIPTSTVYRKSTYIGIPTAQIRM